MSEAKGFHLSKQSIGYLRGIHPDLRKLVDRAIEITPHDFRITCGLRSIEEQKYLVRTKKSRTMRSRHLTGHAIDFFPVPGDWDDLGPFRAIGAAFKQAAKELGIAIEWGGDWGWDYPHIQLDWKEYP